MSVVERFRSAWSSRVEPGLYRGGRVALLPADAVLSVLAKRSYPLFRVWQRWSSLTERWFDEGAAPDAASYDSGALAALRERGCSLAPSGYDADAVRAARDWVVERARAARKRAGDGSAVTKREEGGIVEEVMPSDGRVRLHFSPAALARAELPEVIRDFADDPRCRALTAAYFDTAADRMVTGVPYYVAEVVTPAEKLESWHIDCLRPTVKCFLLLDDVGEEQAPLRYIERSHVVDEERTRLFYDIAHGGLGAAYFDADACAAYDRRARHVVGPAGTVLAFDNRGIHAGSICKRGARVTLATGYRPPQARRLTPRLFRDPTRTPYPWERATAAPPHG